MLVILMAACGSTSGRPTPALDPRAKFIADADALCVANGQRLRAVKLPATPAEIPIYMDQAIPSNEDLLRQLRALKPPPADRAAVGAIFDDFDAVLTRARAYRDAAVTGDDTATHGAYEELTAAVAKAADDARRFGMRSCASAGAAASPSAAPQ